MLAFTFETTQEFLDDRGGRSGFILLGSFLTAFLLIRTSARLIRSPKLPWWPGSVTTKGGLLLGLIGVFFPPVSIAGSLRLAAPSSPWARWGYPPDGRRMARSRARFERVRERRRRLMNAIGGAPSDPEIPASTTKSG